MEIIEQRHDDISSGLATIGPVSLRILKKKKNNFYSLTWKLSKPKSISSGLATIGPVSLRILKKK